MSRIAVLAVGVGLCGLAAGASTITEFGSGQDDDRRTEASDADDVAPPRIKVAGLDSLWIRAEVRFAVEGSTPHRLETALAFPSRARIELRPEGGRESARVLRYRRGSALFGIELRSEKSRRITGVEAARELLQIELRLAAFVYPEAHAWRAVEGESLKHTVDVPSVGTLTAHIDPETKQPTRIEARLTSGELLEFIDVLERSKDERGRAWPSKLELHTPTQHVWTETVTAVERRVLWADDWFTPPDRRSRASQPIEGERAVDLLAEVFLDVPFATPPKSLDAALELARERRPDAAAKAEQHGAQLVPGVRILLGAGLEPRAMRWVVRDREDLARPLPKGWAESAPRPGRVLLLDHVRGATPARVGGLERSFGSSPDERGRGVEIWVGAEASGPGSIRVTLARRTSQED